MTITSSDCKKYFTAILKANKSVYDAYANQDDDPRTYSSICASSKWKRNAKNKIQDGYERIFDHEDAFGQDITVFVYTKDNDTVIDKVRIAVRNNPDFMF